MSDAQGVPAQDDTAPMAANPTAASKVERASSGRVVRLLATVGALVFAYAAWLPWAIVSTNIGDRATLPLLVDPNSAFIAGYFKIGDITPSPFVVAAFSMLGLLLAPLLWRPADSLLGAIATHAFGLWLIFATVFVIAFGISPLVSGTPQPNHGTGLAAIETTTGHLALGFWVVVVALVVMWIAVIGLLIGEWRRHAFWHLPGNDEDRPRALLQLPGASVLNLGLIIWAFGFLSMGWAAVNCTQTPLLLGSCKGIPASSALFAGLVQASGGIVVTSANDPNMLLFLDPAIAQNAIGILLGVGAAMIFVGVWLRAVTRTFCVWTTLWLVAAVALVGLAYSGVGAIIAHPRSVGMASGNWTAQSGVFVTLIGLIIALIGLATLSATALLRRNVE
ncbi:MAG TPA: hypothetical protein VFW76_01560 [Ktedonobacterales bacterium]|nr:hypothetical protein [Ktedonobacterales bacterium]